MNHLILQIEAEATRIQMPEFPHIKSLTNACLYLRRLNQKRFCAVLQPDSVDIIPFDGDTMMQEFGMTAEHLLEIGVYDVRAHFYVAAYDVLHGPVCQKDAWQMIQRFDTQSQDQFESFVVVAKEYFGQVQEVV